MTLFYILVFLLVLGIVVLIHELGHFLFAKRAGILCHEFSIGMGPALYKFKRGETVYALRAIPIGGFVSAAGEDPQTAQIKTGQTVHLEISNNEVRKIYLNPPKKGGLEVRIEDFDLYGEKGNRLYITYNHLGNTYTTYVARDCMYVWGENKEQQIAPYDRCYESKTWFQRFFFVVMGAGFNFILATLIFIIINIIQGLPSNDPIINNPNLSTINTPAKLAGLQKGDIILRMNDTDIATWQDITDFMENHQGGSISLTIKRDGKVISGILLNPLITINSLGITSDVNLDGTTIGAIGANSKADKIGLLPGDIITKVNGVTVQNWEEIRQEFEKYVDGEEITLSYIRNGQAEQQMKLTLLKAIDPSLVARYSIGVSPIYKFSFFGAIGQGFLDTIGVIGSVFETIGLLFTNDKVGIGDLSGPIGIFDMTKTFAMGGLLNLLWWVGFISANIGFVNLLPFPALDGGRLIFLLIEAVVRKPINRKVEGYIHAIGFVLFMILFIYVTFNDIIRLRG